MLDVYYWPTPNGHKITLFVEEAGLDYRIVPVAIGKGEQFKPEFLRISPNNKMPALVDDTPADGGPPLTLFESGAILVYLAEKTGRFLPTDLRGRNETLAWLFWQMGAVGPMLGQNAHFSRYAPEKLPYAIERFQKETSRLYQVLETRLRDRTFVVGDYSIADMAIYPWICSYAAFEVPIAEFPNVKRWVDTIAARPATARAYDKAKAFTTSSPTSAEQRQILFGQSAETLRNANKGIV
jgi:GSH-dependent disulfide-bond oxidoreductase